MEKAKVNSVGIVETRIVKVVDESRPLKLVCGKSLKHVDVAYETYGELNEKQDNAVLVCHALSGNAHAAGKHSHSDRKPGWWEDMIGPGKGIDTNKYFVICSNFLGGCSGTTGPSSINPDTGKRYGLDFPIITIRDMVTVQKLLLDKLGIEQLHAVVGGSMGGMQAIQWAIDYPEVVKAVIPIATTTKLNAQSIAFDAVGRNAILADQNFNNGEYETESGPNRGLAIARMIGHITYLSEEGMRKKFGRQLRKADKYSYDFNSEFSVETYLDYQGRRFVERFDANCYLYITKAMDYFDLEREYGSLKKALMHTQSRFLIVSFTSDWLFTPQQSKDVVKALSADGKDVSYCNLQSGYGHDAFLLETETLGAFISSFLDATYDPRGALRVNEERKRYDFSHYERAKRARVDYELIESLIETNAKVLDTGCGDGELLANLIHDKNIRAKGIELNQDLVLECVKRGIPIVQHDIEEGLKRYSDKKFDYVILSQTVQTVKDPEKVFKELLRIGKKVVVSFPNFAHWKSRYQLFFGGRAPVTKQLPFTWYNSPNIHFLSIKDFDRFCKKAGVKVEKKIPLKQHKLSPIRFAPNLFAEQVIFVTSTN